MFLMPWVAYLKDTVQYCKRSTQHHCNYLVYVILKYLLKWQFQLKHISLTLHTVDALMCQMCQVNVPAQWVLHPQCQMTRLWIIDLSKSIVSTSISRPLSVGRHLCMCPYPVRNHCRSPSTHTRWLPSGSRRLTHSMVPCVGECCM